jgi:hypothetical protein
MPIIPTRFAAEFGEVFPFGAFVLGVEPSMEFQQDSQAPKRQERDRETNQLVWVVRALDANEEAARFGAEFKVKVTAPQQPVPPPKIQGFPYAPVEFDGLTITPYANNRGGSPIASAPRACGRQVALRQVDLSRNRPRESTGDGHARLGDRARDGGSADRPGGDRSIERRDPVRSDRA